VIPFADLLERLLFSPGRNAKLALLVRYFETVPDPDRGLALAAIAGTLDFPAAKAGLIRDLAATRTDPELFAMSYDYVGDLAETVALMWPTDGGDTAPRLSEVVASLRDTPKPDLPALVEAWLDASTQSVRLALLKLITGGLRVGATARLAKLALARMSQGRVTDAEIEEIWHAIAPPYESLFAWLEGKGPRPDIADRPVFRPPMLANPLEESDLASLNAADYVAEWKWDGIRVQLLGGAEPRVFSRAGEDISTSFPDIAATLTHRVVLDGELLVLRAGHVAPFADLQQRLNRKAPARKLLENFPAHVRLYDILFDGDEDLRPLPFAQRRARLESWHASANPARADLSQTIAFTTLDDLAVLRAGAREAGIEGLMLKRADSPYVPGRPRGLWWKWKRDPLTIDAVVMYAQRGHGRRSSFYSDFTFGVWDGEALVPVGRAYSGISDRELAFLDHWVRHHTTARFGPVREVEKTLVLEIAFDGAQRSTRHRSGVALRFPRIARLRRDKPAAEADTLANIANLLPGETP
jgi:DNA ligase-1